MAGTVLAYLDGGDGDNQRLAWAALAARKLDAHLSGLLVTPVPDVVVLAEPTAEHRVAAALRHDAALAGDAIEKRLDLRMRELEAETDLHRLQIAEATTARAVAGLATNADLYVATRPSGGRRIEGVITRQVLFTSGRPCLILPLADARRPTFRTILIAWNDSSEAARAIASSMPLLQCAERIIVVTGNRDGAASLSALLRHLRRHRVVAASEVLADDGDTGSILLDASFRYQADLVVMGAYGRSRLGEWLLGGVSEHLLGHADTALFMTH